MAPRLATGYLKVHSSLILRLSKGVAGRAMESLVTRLEYTDADNDYTVSFNP